MVFQSFFSLVFLFTITICPYTNCDGTSSVYESFFGEKQMGIVEFLPLTSGVKVKINAKGEHGAELRSASGRMVHVWAPDPFQWYQIRDLNPGIYFLAVSVGGGENEVFQILIRD